MIDYEGDKPRGMNYIIMDGASFLYVACHPNKLLDESGNPVLKDNKSVYTDKSLEDVLYNLSNILISIFTKLDAGYYLGFLDGKDSFRKKINPNYKANRADYIPPKWINEAKEYLINDWNFKKVDCVEADDMTLVHAKHYKGLNPIIVTNDKDLLHVSGLTYNWKKDQFKSNSDAEEREFFWLQMIMGDTADNMPGIPKMGEKKGTALLQEIETDNKYPQVVFNKYIEKFGEEEGIRQFILHYECLKIRTRLEDIPCSGLKIFDWEIVPGSY